MFKHHHIFSSVSIEALTHCRRLHYTQPRLGLFGNGDRPSSNSKHRSLFQTDANDPMSFFKPANNSKPPVNPADILKKNDILMYSNKPNNYIESIKKNGFHLSNNYLVTSPDSNGDIIGLCLVDSETFEVNLGKGNGNDDVMKFEIKDHLVTFSDHVLSVFTKVHPKPELVVIGLGKRSRMLSPKNKNWFSNMGIQLEISDSVNSGQIFDLLSTERPGVIGAFLLPPNI
ncbi:hypothetical protein KGF56_000752 [Candida oxycetoniae]|uniref:NADH dehydrogenase [ubiquinone] 1 alpha subcomplex assembly factor 3 n=1 Tax=Candida oxycetoniae TaxID=497107 RepID=A0AAI9T0P5_9ASCO|nr:uncharacterized protein KGF56_000752 [Candida oxycetoniae]KAI3406272.2 hypothetical protein KGF56_000752 [Candida oxycetoniae]